VALTTCPDCQRKVSTGAASCPGCGRSLQAVRRAGLTAFKVIFSLVVFALTFAGAMIVILGGLHVPEYTKEIGSALIGRTPTSRPKAVGYIDFVRNPDERGPKFPWISGNAVYVNDSGYIVESVLGRCVALADDGQTLLGEAGPVSSFAAGDAVIYPPQNRRMELHIEISAGVGKVAHVACGVERTTLR